MSEYQFALLLIFLLSVVNTARFEKQRAKALATLQDVDRTIAAAQAAGIQDPAILKAAVDAKDVRVATAMSGNWLPSCYRQLLIATTLGAIGCAVDSAKWGIVAFLGFCLFFSSAALRFWITTFAHRTR